MTVTHITIFVQLLFVFLVLLAGLPNRFMTHTLIDAAIATARAHPHTVPPRSSHAPRARIPIPYLFSTGLSEDGKPIQSGLQPDPHWTLSVNGGPHAYVMPPQYNVWLANDDKSQWIGPTSQASTTSTAASGLFAYTTTFNLTDFIPHTALITGRFSSDNTIWQVFLNGVLLPGFTMLTDCPSLTYETFTNFSITTAFVNGINELTFIVVNQQGPTGFRVELSGVAVPTRHAHSPRPPPPLPPPNSFSLTSLFSTGYGSNNAPIFSSDTPVPGWTIGSWGATQAIGPELYVSYQPNWVNIPYNLSLSQWLSPKSDTSGVASGLYTFNATFLINSTLDPRTAYVEFFFSVDDWLHSVLLNGVLVSSIAPYTFGPCNDITFQTFSPMYNITSGFVSGRNVLQFIVYNVQGPVGFRAHINGYVLPYTHAILIPSLFSTGLGADGTPLTTTMAIDQHWNLSINGAPTTPTYLASFSDDQAHKWSGNSQHSRWVGPTHLNNPPSGYFAYTTTFSLVGFDPSLKEFEMENLCIDAYMDEGHVSSTVNPGIETLFKKTRQTTLSAP